MKMKANKSDLVEKSTKKIVTNGTIEKKKKKKKDNFEVRIPRIIVRNLNFKVNEDKLKKTFEKCSSSITNISIVTKDGQSKGFGFITFDKLEDAQKAIQTMNGQKILGRPMAVDWSLPKNVYEKMHQPNTSVPIQHDSYGIQAEIKPSKIQDEPMTMEPEEDDDEHDTKDEQEANEEITKIRTDQSSRDVREHRTLFVRNVHFDATEDELSNILSDNGQRKIVSCRLVIDPISRHPRGSAFVQFASAEHAKQCLDNTFTFRGQELQIDMALGRNELAKAKGLRDQNNENNHNKDQRNLSLAQYGVILKLADLDGNENDLRKRQQLEDVKKRKLQNPLFFISSTRLTIHNLPTSIDDEKLRKIVIQTLKDNDVAMKDIGLNECRVMKNTKEAKKSLGYGFLNFTRHEIARRVIDLLNNNKFIFGPNRRPIVQFAVENRQALQLKEQRRERLQAKQELFKNPTNKILAFESNKKKNRHQSNSFDQNKKKIRLSELIKQENDDDDDQNKIKIETSNNSIDFIPEKVKKRKRPKTKSKGEIRDKLDRMIDNMRNKPQLPKRTKTKWFE